MLFSPGRPHEPSLPGKLKGDRLPASSSYEAAGLTKITIAAAKRQELMLSTVTQQPVVVNTAAETVLADPGGNEFCVVRPKATLTG